ncbi:MAG TPA: helix-turn-helix transcriptional regulator [Thermotogota bacterium]|nr:helix-turn-helix transcriptional regulator [Thermotogota bacterium]
MIDKNDARIFLKEIGLVPTEEDKRYGEIISRLSTKLLVYRHENNLSQSELAKKMGLSLAKLKSIEDGDQNISIENLSELENTLENHIYGKNHRWF